MNLKEQEYVCALAENGTITAAAKELFISQPALTASINKLEEESPNLLDLILDDKIDLVIDTPSQGVGRSKDGFLIRRYAIETGVTCLTSLDTADALLTSLETGNRDQLSVVDIAQI